jgi:hypothetical protein
MYAGGSSVRKLLCLTFILFFFLSCKNSTLEETKYQLLKEWIYAQHVEILVPSNTIIERPPGAEILVLQLNFPSRIHCVYYQVPFKTQVGKLTVVEIKNSLKCPEASQLAGMFEISMMNNLKLTYQNFHLHVSFEHETRKESLEIPMYNVIKSVTHQKFRSKKIQTLLPGLTLTTTAKHFIGQLNDRFSNRQALRCHQVNAKCETVGEFRCDECRFGHYEVADYNCPQGGSKFCGQNYCGEKNEPACPLGYKIFQHEDTGICQSDLLPVYNADHILVCQ